MSGFVFTFLPEHKNMLAKDKVLKGRYRIIDQLGSGETGSVYETYDSVRQTTVSLKEILIDSEKVPTINERETIKRAFANKAKFLAEVKHESLPQIRGYFSEFDRQYLVMELIDGDDASQLIAKTKSPLSFSEAASWADQLLDALDYLHTLKPPIYHGDIKPQNVKMTARGRIKLLGFDITENTDTKINTIVTNQNSVTAALPYLPLEQNLRMADRAALEAVRKNYSGKVEKILKQSPAASGDVYSLGATLYHLLTAQPPINALERTLEIWAEKPDPLKTPSQINPTIPVEVSEIVLKAMEIEPENRFGSAMEMRQELQIAVANAKDREVSETRKLEQAVAREALLAEEKRLGQERQLVEKERARLEEERKQQAQVIQEQLKVAETERLKAEQRAAEAEKQLSEKAAKNADGGKSSKTAAQKSFSAENSAKNLQPNTAFSDAGSLFAEPKQSKKPAWIMPAVIVVFLLIGGAAAGIWALQSSDAAASKQSDSTEATLVNKTNAEKPIEPQPQPTVEQISATVAPPTPVAAPVSDDRPASQPTVRNKPAAPAAAAKVEKPAAPVAPKAPTNQKKPVTVDDIIGGN